jgi:hypothetical protein
MDYRYTDTNKTAVMIDMTVGDIEELREVLVTVHKAGIEGVSKWAVGRMIRTLAEAQAKAAQTMEFDAKLLADRAKLPENF